MGGLGVQALGAVSKAFESTGRVTSSALGARLGNIAGAILGLVPGMDTAAGVAGKAVGGMAGDGARMKEWMGEGLASFSALRQKHGLAEQVASLPSSSAPPLGGLGDGLTGGAAAGKQLFDVVRQLRAETSSLEGQLDAAQQLLQQPGLLLPAAPGGTAAETQQRLQDVATMLQTLVQQLEPQRPGGVGGNTVIR